MTKHLLLILLPILLIVVAGCKKQQAAGTDSAVGSTQSHQPLPPQYQAKYDRSVEPIRIDIEKAITSSTPVKLSEVASSIEYYQVGDDKYPITDVVATNDGFIALNQPKLYLYRKGMKRKRIGLKTEYGNWIARSKQHLFFDKSTNRLHAHVKQINRETGYGEYSIIQTPPLEKILARTHYLYPDSLPDTRFILQKNIQLFSDKNCAAYSEEKNRYDNGLVLFNSTGDTLCLFLAGIDPTIPRGDALYNPPFFNKMYWFDKQATFRISFCDTIYRIIDEQTYKPIFVTDFGKHRLTSIENSQGKERKNKVWMTGLDENAKGLFIQAHKEGKTNQGGWIEKETSLDIPSAEYQIVYLKSSDKTFTLPEKAEGLVNNLDDGLPFWPDGQTDGYLYMIRPVKELKTKAKLTDSPRQKKLKTFLEEADEKQNVMIIIK